MAAAQWVKHLLCEHKDLGSHTQNPREKLNMASRAYNLVLGLEVQRGRSLKFTGLSA